MSDTTAQEAMIPYPNEVGLMKRFVLGLQPVQSFAVIESVGSSARVIKSESEKKMKDLNLSTEK